MSKYLLIGAALAFSSLSARAEVQFKGDFRFRNEEIKEEQAGAIPTGDRFRERVRLRAGASAKVNEKTDVTFRLATGSLTNTDNTSTNQDLGDYYAKKQIELDMAYFNYKASETVQILGGKTPIYFNSAGAADIVFDTDLTPEGLALKYKSVGDGPEYFGNLGVSWLSERYSATGATDNTDVGLVGAQAGVTFKPENYTVLLQFSQYNFSNIKGSTAISAKGNTLVGGAYAQGYNLSAFDAEIGSTLLGLPCSLYYEMVSNADGGKYKNAAVVGIKLGKMKDVGSWTFIIDNREVEKDAVVGVLTDSDSSGGGTDIRSTRFVGAYQIAENSNIGLTWMNGKKSISSTAFSPNYTRAMLDFNFNF